MRDVDNQFFVQRSRRHGQFFCSIIVYRPSLMVMVMVMVNMMLLNMVMFDKLVICHGHRVESGLSNSD